MPTIIQKGDTFFAQKGAYFDGTVKIDGNFTVPARTHFWGRLSVTGTLELGPGSSIALGVDCWNAIISLLSIILIFRLLSLALFAHEWLPNNPSSSAAKAIFLPSMRSSGSSSDVNEISSWCGSLRRA